MTAAGPVEFSALVYGSFVASLLEMTEDVEEVNKKLDEIGYKVGLRLAHDFGSDTKLERVDDPDKIINDVIRQKWKYLSGSKEPTVKKDDKTYELTFAPSVFTQNVQVPELYNGVHFTGMLPGALRGIFEIFHYKVSTKLLESDEKIGTKIEVVVEAEIPIAIPKTDD